MRKNKRNEIRTVRYGLKVGERVMKDGEPVALVKQGERYDSFTLEEFAGALYGPGTRCIVVPGKEAVSF
jgi:hypothetical protein